MLQSNAPEFGRKLDAPASLGGVDSGGATELAEKTKGATDAKLKAASEKLAQANLDEFGATELGREVRDAFARRYVEGADGKGDREFRIKVTEGADLSRMLRIWAGAYGPVGAADGPAAGLWSVMADGLRWIGADGEALLRRVEIRNAEREFAAFSESPLGLEARDAIVDYLVTSADGAGAAKRMRERVGSLPLRGVLEFLMRNGWTPPDTDPRDIRQTESALVSILKTMVDVPRMSATARSILTRVAAEYRFGARG